MQFLKPPIVPFLTCPADFKWSALLTWPACLLDLTTLRHHPERKEVFEELQQPCHNVWKLLQKVSFYKWHFPTIFVLLKLTCLVTLFDRKLQVFKNSPKWTIFGIFIFFLSTQKWKCKCSSLHSRCWMRLFLWFSNTVQTPCVIVVYKYQLLLIWPKIGYCLLDR